MQIIIIVQVVAFLIFWSMSPFKVLPKPGETWQGFVKLWTEQGLYTNLVSSFMLNVKALAITTVISLGFAYLSVMPFFRPIVSALSKGRFLSLVGFSLLFTLVFEGGATLKLVLLVFGMSVFFITSMASVVTEIPKEAFDHARTLRMSEWRVVWEVVIRGTADRALEVMRQNAAIGWMMLTMVEGIVRSEGGVGVQLLNNQKYMNLAAVWAIQITILILAVAQDAIIGLLRRVLFPYSVLTVERAS